MQFTSDELRVLEEKVKEIERRRISGTTNVRSFVYGTALKNKSLHYRSVGDLPKARELNAKACEQFYPDKDEDRSHENSYMWCVYYEAEMAHISGDATAAMNALDTVQASINNPMLSETERMYRMARCHSLRATMYRDMGDIQKGLDEAIKANKLFDKLIEEL